MSSSTPARRKTMRMIDIGLVIFVIVVLASILSPTISMIVGTLVWGSVALAVVRFAWPHTIGEWRKDRALIREIGPLDGPPPILLINSDGSETIIKSTDPAYPAEKVRQAEAAATLARRPRQG